jgi:predicted AlkP superfamily phosphohydrolase/phosphomutase
MRGFIEMTTRKTLIIGLDGATFTVLAPLMKKNCLPNIQRMMAKGSSGTLQSTIPPVTAPAWLALATGMCPDKAGVYDFVIRRDAQYHLRSLNSSYFHGRAIWDHLSQHGRTVGLLNYPLLRPPYPVNGIMVAGIGAVPGEEYTYPASLKDEFYKVLGSHYEIMLPLNESRYEDSQSLLRDIYTVLDKQVKIADYLLSKKEWDLFWFVLSVTDWAQHFLWRHIDKTHPLNEGGKSDLIVKDFEAFWIRIDETIGKLCEIVGPETNILILSDHGFGPHNQVFRLNGWLEQQGYIVRKKTGSMNKLRRTLNQGLQTLALKTSRFKIIPAGLYKLGRRSLEKVRVDVSDQIDLTSSVAFDPGHTVPLGGIYINDSVITDATEREIIAGEIILKLKDWGAKNGVEIETWQPDLSVNIEAKPQLPDIIVGINNWACQMIKDSFDGPLFENRPYTTRITGSHRREGVFICSGPDIRNIYLEKADICDIAPTLFHMFDLAVPSYVDGRVLIELYDPAYLADHPVKTEQNPEGNDQQKIQDYTQNEEEAIKKQLQDLGYM